MARLFLWVVVVIVILATCISTFTGDNLHDHAYVLLFSALGVLAVCESIESSKKK